MTKISKCLKIPALVRLLHGSARKIAIRSSGGSSLIELMAVMAVGAVATAGMMQMMGLLTANQKALKNMGASGDLGLLAKTVLRSNINCMANFGGLLAPTGSGSLQSIGNQLSRAVPSTAATPTPVPSTIPVIVTSPVPTAATVGRNAIATDIELSGGPTSYSPGTSYTENLVITYYQTGNSGWTRNTLPAIYITVVADSTGHIQSCYGNDQDISYVCGYVGKGVYDDGSGGSPLVNSGNCTNLSVGVPPNGTVVTGINTAKTPPVNLRTPSICINGYCRTTFQGQSCPQMCDNPLAALHPGNDYPQIRGVLVGVKADGTFLCGCPDDSTNLGNGAGIDNAVKATPNDN